MRVLERLDELYAIGATRIGGSPEENAAHALARRWLEEAGLAVEVDAAGNLIGRRGSGETWIGSHLDTVPNGGRFDGALGVVAGIEVAERSDAPLAVVAFRDEERGCAGSRARVAAGPLPRAYLELHIEQGPVLARAGAPLGLVTAITGQARGEVVFEGAAGHAGTTPMDSRRDALVEAARFVLHVREAARDDAVATVGRVEVEPGAVNVIPARVRVSVDARSPDPARLDELVREIGFEPTYRTPPVAMSGAPFEALRATLEDPVVELPSGAGHDAGILAAAGVPAAMLFVRSLNGGVSHSPDELSSPEDVELAVQVLTAALDRIGR
jgi:acetylornithine deacetylase/succinyl-diaminopimelate desuccinylase-like protein